MKKKEEITNPQSCLSKADPEEMLFVLLARDAAAPGAIRFWASERLRMRMNDADDDKIKEALACADAMYKQRVVGDFS